jgi:P-type conjugative transfer protein TrbJ
MAIVGSTIAAALSAAAAPHTAHAIFGEEDFTLGAILTQEIAAVAKAGEEVTQLINTVQRLESLKQQGEALLSTAKGGGVSGVLNTLQGTLQLFRSIDGDIKYIGYELKSVDQQRAQVYQASLSGVPSTQFPDRYARWHEQLAEASQVAMRAQTNLDVIEQRNKVQQQILNDSEQTPGVVGQLQLVVRGLGVLHADLEALQRSLDTGMRVTSSMAAIQASTEDMRTEDANHMGENYTDRGPRVTAPNELP